MMVSVIDVTMKAPASTQVILPSAVAAPRADLPWPQVCDERPGLGSHAGTAAGQQGSN
jgi:hypothetical protein